MGALIWAAVVVMIATATPASADPVDRWRALIAEASTRFGVPALWIERVMRAESRGLTTLDGRPITSRAGAMGLMQLMPTTWLAMRARLGLGANPHDPHDNIMAGAFYLRLMYERFGYPGLFGAYNAGPARYGRFVAGRQSLPAETRVYVVSVAARPAPLVGAPVKAADGRSLFFAPGLARLSSQRPASLFVRLAANGAEKSVSRVADHANPGEITTPIDGPT